MSNVGPRGPQWVSSLKQLPHACMHTWQAVPPAGGHFASSHTCWGMHTGRRSRRAGGWPHTHLQRVRIMLAVVGLERFDHEAVGSQPRLQLRRR